MSQEKKQKTYPEIIDKGINPKVQPNGNIIFERIIDIVEVEYE